MHEQSFQDQNLSCRDCGMSFVWTAGEQEYYSQKGFQAPSRCPNCRTKRKANFQQNRQMTKITCAKCDKEDEVPFVPKNGTDVLCRDCFKQQRQGGA